MKGLIKISEIMESKNQAKLILFKGREGIFFYQINRSNVAYFIFKSTILVFFYLLYYFFDKIKGYAENFIFPFFQKNGIY